MDYLVISFSSKCWTFLDKIWISPQFLTNVGKILSDFMKKSFFDLIERLVRFWRFCVFPCACRPTIFFSKLWPPYWFWCLFVCFFEDFCVYLHFLGSKGPGPKGPGPKGIFCISRLLISSVSRLLIPSISRLLISSISRLLIFFISRLLIFCISRLLYFFNWGGLLTEGGSYVPKCFEIFSRG